MQRSHIIRKHPPSFSQGPNSIAVTVIRKKCTQPKPVCLSAYNVSLQTGRCQLQIPSGTCTLTESTSPAGVGDVQGVAGPCFSLIDVSDSPSLSLPLCKKNNIFFKKHTHGDGDFSPSLLTSPFCGILLPLPTWEWLLWNSFPLPMCKYVLLLQEISTFTIQKHTHTHTHTHAMPSNGHTHPTLHKPQNTCTILFF